MTADALPLETLKNIPLLEGFDDEECRQLQRAARVVEFEPGEVILRQGQCSRNLWILLEGKCEVFTDPSADRGSGRRALSLAELEPYSQFGEMSFYRSAPHSASVRAKTPVKLMRIEREDYESLIADGSKAAYKLACNAVESLADRLERMDEWVAKLVHDSSSAPRVGEWDNFRKKLFNGWDL